jgi:Flp pilus assembly pilin Flp
MQAGSDEEDVMQMFRRFVHDESNAFLVESGLLGALIAAVILLRVISYLHGL